MCFHEKYHAECSVGEPERRRDRFRASVGVHGGETGVDAVQRAAADGEESRCDEHVRGDGDGHGGRLGQGINSTPWRWEESVAYFHSSAGMHIIGVE